MEIAPNDLEICLKLNRFVCSEAENDVVALTDSRVRILSSHELASLTTIVFSESQPSPLSPLRLSTQREVPKSNMSVASEPQYFDSQRKDPNSVFIDGGVEEFPKRKPSKFLHMLNQERKSRWATDENLVPVDGADPAEKEHVSRLNKGMHVPPKAEQLTLNPIKQEQVVAKQICSDMFMDILAHQRSQQFVDNLSQVSGASAKERILRDGHATGIPNNLRQL